MNSDNIDCKAICSASDLERNPEKWLDVLSCDEGQKIYRKTGEQGARVYVLAQADQPGLRRFNFSEIVRQTAKLADKLAPEEKQHLASKLETMSAHHKANLLKRNGGFWLKLTERIQNWRHGFKTHSEVADLMVGKWNSGLVKAAPSDDTVDIQEERASIQPSFEPLAPQLVESDRANEASDAAPAFLGAVENPTSSDDDDGEALVQSAFQVPTLEEAERKYPSVGTYSRDLVSDGLQELKKNHRTSLYGVDLWMTDSYLSRQLEALPVSADYEVGDPLSVDSSASDEDKRAQLAVLIGGIGEKLAKKTNAILVPVNVSNHFSLLVVNPIKGEILHLDGLKSVDKRKGSADLNLVIDTVRGSLPDQQWAEVSYNENSVQSDGWTCGFWVIHFAKSLLEGIPLEQIDRQLQDETILVDRVVDYMNGELRNQERIPVAASDYMDEIKSWSTEDIAYDLETLCLVLGKENPREFAQSALVDAVVAIAKARKVRDPVQAIKELEVEVDLDLLGRCLRGYLGISDEEKPLADLIQEVKDKRKAALGEKAYRAIARPDEHEGFYFDQYLRTYAAVLDSTSESQVRDRLRERITCCLIHANKPGNGLQAVLKQFYDDVQEGTRSVKIATWRGLEKTLSPSGFKSARGQLHGRVGATIHALSGKGLGVLAHPTLS